MKTETTQEEILHIGDKVTVIDPLAKRAGRKGLIIGVAGETVLVLFRDGASYYFKTNQIK